MASDQDINEQIAERVRDAAKAAGVTNEDLALKVGIAGRTFSRLLAGQSDWKARDVARIARALDTPMAHLLPVEVAA